MNLYKFIENNEFHSQLYLKEEVFLYSHVNKIFEKEFFFNAIKLHQILQSRQKIFLCVVDILVPVSQKQIQFKYLLVTVFHYQSTRPSIYYFESMNLETEQMLSLCHKIFFRVKILFLIIQIFMWLSLVFELIQHCSLRIFYLAIVITS